MSPARVKHRAAEADPKVMRTAERGSRRAAAVLLAMLAAMVAGCSSPQPSPAPTTRPAADASRTAAESAFLDRLAVIAAPLAESPDRAIRRAENSCDDRGLSQDKHVAQVAERFSGGTYTVTTGQAQAILAAAQQTVCASA